MTTSQSITVNVTQILNGGYIAKCGEHTAIAMSGPEVAAAACGSKVFECHISEIVCDSELPIYLQDGYPVYPCGNYICRCLNGAQNLKTYLQIGH